MNPMWLMGLTSWSPDSANEYPVLAWKSSIHEDVALGAEYGQPAVLDEHIYVGVSSGPGVLVFDESTGTQVGM